MSTPSKARQRNAWYAPRCDRGHFLRAWYVDCRAKVCRDLRLDRELDALLAPRR